MTLRLKAPYGAHGQHHYGTGIRIVWQGEGWPDARTAERMTGMAMGYGCPPPIADKVRDCIYASGSYDCIVQVQEVPLKNFACAAEMLGFKVYRVDFQSGLARNLC